MGLVYKGEVKQPTAAGLDDGPEMECCAEEKLPAVLSSEITLSPLHCKGTLGSSRRGVGCVELVGSRINLSQGWRHPEVMKSLLHHITSVLELDDTEKSMSPTLFPHPTIL